MKSKMKKTLVLLVALVMVFAMTSAAMADTPQPPSEDDAIVSIDSPENEAEMNEQEESEAVGEGEASEADEVTSNESVDTTVSNGINPRTRYMLVGVGVIGIGGVLYLVAVLKGRKAKKRK